MTKTKVTPQRPELPLRILRQNRNQQRVKQTYTYKIKFTLPEQKQVDFKRNGDIFKTTNVRCKSKYFDARSARQC